MTWDQACDALDELCWDIAELWASGDAAPFPALDWYEMKVRAAERAIDEAYGKEVLMQV